MYRPTHVDLRDAEPLRRGLEVLVSAAGINANYAGATRELAQPDPNTPSADVAIYELGAGVQYWYGRNFRAAFNYLANLTPDSVPPGTVGATNQAIVPSNVAGGDGDVGHELSARLAVTF